MISSVALMARATLGPTPEGNGFGWTGAFTTGSGATANGGTLNLSLTAGAGAQVASLFANDLLAFPLRGLQHLWFTILLTAGGKTIRLRLPRE